VILTLLLIFVFFGKKMGQTDFSIDSMFDDNGSTKDIENSSGQSIEIKDSKEGTIIDKNAPEKIEPQKAKISGSILGILEASFSNKEVNLFGETNITRSDGTKIKLNSPTLYNFDGSFVTKEGQVEITGSVTKIISEGAEIEFKELMQVKIIVSEASIKDVKFGLERSGLTGELSVNSYNVTLNKAYVNMKNYLGTINIKDGKYNFDGECDLITVKQDGKEISFK
jgi:hypothetical protein